MGMGQGAGGAEGSTALAGGGADTLSQAAGGGVGGGLASFFQNPENLKFISDLLKHGASLQGTMQKAPPQAQQLFQEMAKSIQSRSGGGQPGVPQIGSLQPTQGPYQGDIPNYSVDPEISRAVLARMGIPYGSS